MSPTPSYRERLTPSLWILISATALIPMITLVFIQMNSTLALILGAVVGIGAMVLMILASPVIEVSGGELRAGRAHIPVDFLGTAVVTTGEEARTARGRGLDARAWHVIRGGIDGVATITIDDREDPTPVWVISSRTPDRLVAAVRAAQITEGAR